MAKIGSSSVICLGLFTLILFSVQRAAAEIKSELQLIKFKAPQLFPKSFDWDRKHKRFILGSMGQGKLITLTEAGVVEDFIQDPEFAGNPRIHGVFVDARRNRVLAVVTHVGGDPESQIASLVAYDLDSRKRTLIVQLEEGGGKTLFNDVCVDYQGTAYITETIGNSVWKVTLAGEKSLFVTIPQQEVLRTAPMSVVGELTGIVYTDGVLIVSQFNSGALMRVRVSDKKVEQVDTLEGLMPGAEGMAARSDGTLVVVSRATAWLLSSRDFWHSAGLVDKVVLEESTFSTSVAAKDNQIYTLATYKDEHLQGLSREDFQVEEIEFPADDANNPLYLLVIVGMFGLLVLIWKFQVNQFNKGYTKKRA